MKKGVLNYLVIATVAISAVFTSCKKDDIEYGKGKGLLKVNGQEELITGSYFCLNANGTIRTICFNNKDDRNIVNIATKGQFEKLTAKSYTTNEIAFVGVAPVGNLDRGDTDVKDFVMNVSINGKTYDITIIGKTIEFEYEYTFTYKGKIRVRDCGD